ncbi:MAG: septum formation inhibitor Maf [Gammaproteobacteria bacterium]|nr:septum formation inhibitor Maf [Gammaproteobacteria bacterium]
MSSEFVYLASASPRRRELLAQIGVIFRTIDAGVDESLRAGEEAQAYVLRLASEKAQCGFARGGRGAPALGADTSVVLDGRVLGKPADRDEGDSMLAALSGRTHTVLTAVALCGAGGLRTALSRTEVDFRPIAAEERGRYWDSGEPRDKAGGYAIQGYAAVFVSGLRGSYSGVVGLPLYETAALLAAAGVPCWVPA